MYFQNRNDGINTKQEERKGLTLKDRVKVIERSKSGETYLKFALDLGVGKNQIQNIIKYQNSILERFKSGEKCKRKNAKRS